MKVKEKRKYPVIIASDEDTVISVCKQLKIFCERKKHKDQDILIISPLSNIGQKATSIINTCDKRKLPYFLFHRYYQYDIPNALRWLNHHDFTKELFITIDSKEQAGIEEYVKHVVTLLLFKIKYEKQGGLKGSLSTICLF